MSLTSTPTNGSDSLTSILGRLIDTGATIYSTRVNPNAPPSPTDAPKIAQPAAGLPPATPAAPASSMIAGMNPLLLVAGILVLSVLGGVLVARSMK